MFFGMQDFDLCPNLIKFYPIFQIYPTYPNLLKFYPNLPKFYPNLLKFFSNLPKLVNQLSQQKYHNT